MRVHTDYILSRICLLLGASALCAITGCWEEIHYTPTAADSAASNHAKQDQAVGQPSRRAAANTATAPSTAQPLADDTGAADFAEDVAAKLGGGPSNSNAALQDRTVAANQMPAVANDSHGNRMPWQEPAADSAGVEATAKSGQSGDSLPATTPPAEAAMATTTPKAASESAMPPIATTPPPSDTDPAHSSRRIAWLLGNKLSLSALANDRGGAVDETAKLFSQARTLAEMLDTTISDLPSAKPTATANANFDRSLQYLFGQGQPIGRALATKYGDDHAALFELAVKSNILLALYRPRASVAGALSSAIEQAGGRSGLPVKLWQPLMDAMANNAPVEEVRQAVYRMHSDVDRYLSSPQRTAPGVASQSQ